MRGSELAAAILAAVGPHFSGDHADLGNVTASQHHVKTTSFSELTDAATDAQIPNDVTIEFAARAGIDGYDLVTATSTNTNTLAECLTGSFKPIGGGCDCGADQV